MSQAIIDVGILTIREDEFRAVLNAFPDDHGIYRGRHREYTLRTADAGSGARYRLAVLRQIEQGNGEAQEAARDLIDDLQPSLLLVVGIAGGLPSDDLSLGDVVLSTRVLDFSVEARKFQEGATYNVGGGPDCKVDRGWHCKSRRARVGVGRLVGEVTFEAGSQLGSKQVVWTKTLAAKCAGEATSALRQERRSESAHIQCRADRL